jgi:hypothetical protein
MKVSSKFTLILYLSVSLLFCIDKSSYSQQFTIGQKHRGGIIFYIDSTGTHGLIAATVDQGKTLGRMGRLDAKSNSDKKLTPFNHNSSQENLDDATIAKRICNYYTTTVKNVTYHTWYLPLRRELQLLYAKKSIVGGFSNGFYWSSTRDERFGGLLLLDFSNGDNYLTGIYCEGFIRPIQAF